MQNDVRKICCVVGNADKLALFAAVEFVIVDVFHGIENQPASGFDFNGAAGCIKQGGMGTNIAAGFDFDTLGRTKTHRVGFGVFMLFDFGNVFAVVPFTGFIAAFVEGVEFALSGVIELVAVGLQFDFAVFRTDIRGAEQDAAVLIGIRCANAHTGFTRKFCSKRRGCLQHARVWAVYRESEYLLV